MDCLSDRLLSYNLVSTCSYICLPSFELVLADILLKIPHSYKILNFFLQLLALFNSVAIILVEEVVFGFVGVGTLLDKVGLFNV